MHIERIIELIVIVGDSNLDATLIIAHMWRFQARMGRVLTFCHLPATVFEGHCK